MCATDTKTISYSYSFTPVCIIATVANDAVRLSIGLRLVGFIHVFQKGDANGHHKVQSASKIIIFELGGSCCFEFVFKVPVIWFVRHLVMLKSFKIFDNFKTLIRKRPKL